MVVDTLVVKFGLSVDRAILFREDEGSLKILDKLEIISPHDRQFSLYFFKKHFLDKFEQTIVIKNEGAAAVKTLSSLSANQEVAFLSVDLSESLIGLGSFSRVQVKSAKLGLGTAALTALTRLEVGSLASWLTFPLSLSDLENYLANKSIYPATLPLSQPELEMEGSLVTEITSLLKKDYWLEKRTMPSKFFLTGEGFRRFDKPSQALLSFMNGFQPTGACQVFLDRENIFAFFGEFLEKTDSKNIEPENHFLSLCDLISLGHQKKIGESLGTIELDLGLNYSQKIDLLAGEIVVVPYGQEKPGRAVLELKKGVLLENLGSDISLRGGFFGIVIDTRGRPLAHPSLDSRDKEMIKKWHTSLDH